MPASSSLVLAMVSLTTVVLAGATHSASVSGPVTVVVTVTPALQRHVTLFGFYYLNLN